VEAAEVNDDPDANNNELGDKEQQLAAGLPSLQKAPSTVKKSVRICLFLFEKYILLTFSLGCHSGEISSEG